MPAVRFVEQQELAGSVASARAISRLDAGHRTAALLGLLVDARAVRCRAPRSPIRATSRWIAALLGEARRWQRQHGLRNEAALGP